MDWRVWLPPAEAVKHFSFLWELALIIVVVKAAGHLSARLGQPTVFGKLLAGVVVGPALLGWLHLTPLLQELAEVGVILLLFMAGLETDFDDFRQNLVAAFLVALMGVLVPLGAGLAVGEAYGHDFSGSLFIGTLLVATSVSISVKTLLELGRLRSREGMTILGAAVIDDVLGLIALSLVLSVAVPAGAEAPIGVVLVKVLVFFAAALVLGRFVLPPLMRWAEGLRVTVPATALAVAVALAFGFMAELFGLATIVGAYLAGLALGLTPFRESLLHPIETVSYSFLVPVFFVSIGLRADLSQLAGNMVGFAVLLTVVAILTKIVGCGLGALLSRFSLRESLVVGTGMVSRGEVGLIVATIGLDRGLIDVGVYTAMVVVVLVTTLVTPPLLKLTAGRAGDGTEAEPVPVS